MVAPQIIPQGTLKMVDLEEIKWDKRYREDLGDIESLAASIKEKGVLQPVTVTPDYKLLAGERRVRASIAAGLKKIPALVRKIEGDIDAREIELMENVFRKNFTWSEEAALIQEIDRLYKERNIDWSGRKTAQLLDKGVASVSRALKLAHAVDVMPELAEVKTADEALKLVGKMEEQAITHELSKRQQASMTSGTLDKGISIMLKMADQAYRVGDTFKGLAEMRNDGPVHIIECDPPYGIDLREMKRSKDSATSNVHTYNEVDQKEYPAFLGKLTKELYRVAAPNSWLIFWFGPTWQHEVLTSLEAAKWEVDIIPGIWVKNQGQTMQPEIYLGRAYEPFYLCRKGKPVLVKRGRLNVFEYPGASKKYHPTERPIALIQELLETLGVPTNKVLVPFLGSGATIRAAYNAGMTATGWDLSSEYKPKFMLAVEEDAKALGAAE